MIVMTDSKTKKRGRPAKVARTTTPTAELLSNMVEDDEQKVGVPSEDEDDGIEATPLNIVLCRAVLWRLIMKIMFIIQITANY